MKIGWKGRLVTGLSQSAYRSYVFPVVSPAGVQVTTERSASDHPWHQSVTIGTDRFYTYLQSPEGPVEQPPLNMYWDWPFQGRDAGRIISSVVDERTERAEDHLEITQRLQWQGPEEWGVGTYRRVLAEEVRIIDVRPGEKAISSTCGARCVRPTGTSHRPMSSRLLHHTSGGPPSCGRQKWKQSWRKADSIGRPGRGKGNSLAACRLGGLLRQGRAGPDGRRSHVPVSVSGECPWYLVDYGSVRINPHRMGARFIKRGEILDLAIRVVAHDGDAEEAGIADLYASFAEEFGRRRPDIPSPASRLSTR